MDWRTIKFDWNRARAFLVTAEEGSLSGAARALGLAQPTLGRQVAALEAELGVALFERGARGLELTPGGLDLLEHVRSMGSAASDLSLAASGRSSSIEGDVAITATEVLAAYWLPRVIRDLRSAHPGIRVELIASNRAKDLRRREADIAIRSFRPTQPNLIAKKLADIEAYLYASSRYLDAIGRPRSPDDLAAADFIGFDRSDVLMPALQSVGFKVTPENFTLLSENHLVQWELVKAGAGIGVMAAEVGDREPGVERVLPELGPLVGEEWIVAHRELRSSRRIRTVFDFLVEAFARRLRHA